MGRDKIKSASLHGFHDEHVEPLPPTPAPGARTPFETLVREMLAQLGDDPTREGLRQTLARVEASLKWVTRGYHMAVADVIGDALYSERHENLVCVRDIEIYSLCEHHLLPFFGRAHVAYLPNDRFVGLSKIRRVYEVCARRLQVQERLTDQVADALMEVLDPRGVGVVIEAYHLCMMMRGVEKQNSKTVTSALRGALLQDAKTRDEFLRLVHGGRGREGATRLPRSSASWPSSPAPRAASGSRWRRSSRRPERTWCGWRAASSRPRPIGVPICPVTSRTPPPWRAPPPASWPSAGFRTSSSTTPASSSSSRSPTPRRTTSPGPSP